MAFQVLQRAKAATAAAATGLTVTLPGATTTGATQVLLIVTSSGSAISTAPTGWTQRASTTAQSNNMYLFDHTTSSTSDKTVTASFASGAASAYLIEANGVVAFDTAVTASGAGPSASYGTGSLTPDVSSGAAWLIAVTDSITNVTDSFSSPVTAADSQYTAISGKTVIQSAYADGTVTSGTATSVTVTPSASASGWETILASYKVQAPPPPADNPPTQPGSFTATPVGIYQINLSWTASTDTDSTPVDHYELTKDGSAIGAWQSGLSYIDAGLAAGSTHTYTITAVDTVGNRSAAASASATTAARVNLLDVGAAAPSALKVGASDAKLYLGTKLIFGAGTTDPSYGKTLAFADEFDALNVGLGQTWGYATPAYSGGTTNPGDHKLDNVVTSAMSVASSVLTMTATQNGSLWNTGLLTTDPGNGTGGNGFLVQAGDFYVARVKMPTGNSGGWPALWTWHSGTTGSSEIDAFEWHSENPNLLEMGQHIAPAFATYNDASLIAPGQWVWIGVTLGATSVTWYVGATLQTMQPLFSDTVGMGAATAYPIINLSIADGTFHTAPSGSTPITFAVDCVRVYR